MPLLNGKEMEVRLKKLLAKTAASKNYEDKRNTASSESEKARE